MTREFESNQAMTFVEMIDNVDESKINDLEAVALGITELVHGISATVELDRTETGDVVIDDELIIEEKAFIFLSVRSLLSKAYLMGRADQVADLYGSSVSRTVKAKDLSATLDAALFLEEADEAERIKGEKPEILDTYRALRGILNPRSVQFIVTEESSESLKAIVEEESVGVVIPSLGKGGYQHLGFFGGVEAIK